MVTHVVHVKLSTVQFVVSLHSHIYYMEELLLVSNYCNFPSLPCNQPVTAERIPCVTCKRVLLRYWQIRALIFDMVLQWKL